MSDDTADDLHWHALNYRTAGTQHAEGMWRELDACVSRRVAAAVAAERERCARAVRMTIHSVPTAHRMSADILIHATDVAIGWPNCPVF